MYFDLLVIALIIQEDPFISSIFHMFLSRCFSGLQFTKHLWKQLICKHRKTEIPWRPSYEVHWTFVLQHDQWLCDVCFYHTSLCVQLSLLCVFCWDRWRFLVSWFAENTACKLDIWIERRFPGDSHLTPLFASPANNEPAVRLLVALSVCVRSLSIS